MWAKHETVGGQWGQMECHPQPCLGYRHPHRLWSILGMPISVLIPLPQDAIFKLNLHHRANPVISDSGLVDYDHFCQFFIYVYTVNNILWENRVMQHA